MSNDLDQAEVNTSDSDVLDYYKSLTFDNREVERDIILHALDCAVVPKVVRYGIFKSVYRGVVQGTDDQLHYFNYPLDGNFHLVLADTINKKWEANKLITKCDLGLDLIKSEKSVEHATEDEEDEKKAEIAGLPPPSISEERNVATQNSQMTTVHPGAAGGQTAQQDGSSERWHGEEPLNRSQEETLNPWTTADLMKAWGQQLQATAPRIATIDPKERKYMVEVLGKMPSEVDSGMTKMSPQHRAQYNAWLTKGLRSKIDNLSNWLNK